MPRIRSIKHDFFLDDELAKLCSIPARLFYISLWILSDDNGVIEWRPDKVKIQTLPYDEVDVEKLLAELIEAQKIRQYTSDSDGKKYIFLKNLLKHQKIDRPRKSNLPLPPNFHMISDDVQMKSDEINLGGDKDKDKEGNKEESISSTEIKQSLTILQKIPEYPFDQNKDIDFLQRKMEEFPEVDPVQLLSNWQAYLIDNPFKKNSSPRSQLYNQFVIADKYRKHQRLKATSFDPVDRLKHQMGLK